MNAEWEAVQMAAERKRLAEQELLEAQLAYHDACGEYEAALRLIGRPASDASQQRG